MSERSSVQNIALDCAMVSNTRRGEQEHTWQLMKDGAVQPLAEAEPSAGRAETNPQSSFEKRESYHNPKRDAGYGYSIPVERRA